MASGMACAASGGRRTHVFRAGCAWEHLPRELPPSGTMHRWFLRLCRAGRFDKMMQVLTALDRAGAGRDPLPATTKPAASLSWPMPCCSPATWQGSYEIGSENLFTSIN